MNRKAQILRLAVLIAMLLSLAGQPGSPAQAAQPSEQLPAATVINWCVAGEINGWDNSSTPIFDDGTNGDGIAGDGIYSLAMSIATAGTYAWKFVECGSWSTSYPAANSWFITDTAGQVVTFSLDTNNYSSNAGMALLPAQYVVNVAGDTLPTSYTAVGDFQGWNNTDANTLMSDLGNGFYRLVYTVPLAGSYIGKIVQTGSWSGFGADGRSTDAANLSFTTTEADQSVVFFLDAYTGRVLIDLVSSGAGTWCAAGGFNGWTMIPLYDDGTHGDLLGGDSVFMADVAIASAGRYEWKVTYNCTWDVSYPGGNSWLNTTESDQIVKLSFDTNNHSADAGWHLAPAINIVHAWDSTSNFTAVGDWQGWNNANPDTDMAAIGRGLYRLDAPVATSGAHEYKVVVTGSWDGIGNDSRSISATNIPFSTNTAGDVVPFLLDYRTGRTGVFPPPPPAHAGHDNEIWWADLGHNSRDTLYRNPGGPVETDTAVVLRMRAASGDLTAAKLRLYNDRTDTQTLLNMTLVLDDGTYEWWQATVPPSVDPTVYWYRFIAIDGTDTDYYEDDAARTMGWGQVFDETNDYSYQLTVYDPAFQTPEWIKNAVVYQVFPDRFRDGDPDNNKAAGSFFYDDLDGTISRSNTTDWNEEICDPRAAGACAGSYSKNFYGGDLQGLLDKLDYLEDLGVTAIYLNPIFESPSNHGYDTTDYLAINPIFGDATVFNALVTEINTRGMHLILDGVFNHVSSDSIYFDRYARYTESGACESHNSPYRSWFYFTPADPVGSGPCVGDDGTPGGSNYESWWGYDSLPKLRANEAAVRELIWDYGTGAATNTVAGYWMQSADGWRLDVGADVDPGTLNDPANDYWEGFRNTVKAVNPEGYITGEEWGVANSWLLGGEWDAVMNYQFGSAVLSYWRDEAFVDNDHSSGSSAGELAPLTAEQFDERIQNLMERYAPEALAAMLNLFGSHDTSRALFMLDHNADLNNATLYANPAYDWSDAITRLKGAVINQMTMPGAPTIYYGDEVGLVGPMAYAGGKWEDDPYNRQPFPWLDASGTPFYTHLQTQPSQDALYDYYASLTAARNDHPALRTGDYRTLLVDNANKLYVYGRRLDGEDAALVFINRSGVLADVSINLNAYLPYDATFDDVLSANNYTADDNALNHVQVPANSGAVLVITSPVTAAPAPTVLSVDTVGDTFVTLTWTAADRANGYYIYRSSLSGGGYELLGGYSGLTYTDTTVIPGQRYYYIVKSHNGGTGLLSEASNEVTALPHYTIGWANLQSPPSITHTLGITPTVNIYGQVYISGVTDIPGATDGLLAQAGYGPDASNPDGNLNWIWVDADFNGQAGNNDEFVAAFLPEAAGIFDYAYRYSTDGGLTWVYADLNGTPDYTTDQAGSMTVNASADTTAPSIPTLSITDWSSSFIDLAWTAATDDVLVYAYDLYRSTDGVTYTKIARILDPDLIYTDMDVVSGTLYYYKVQTVDTSFNFGGFSNIVSHLAEPKMVDVTFNITVPDFTPGTVYIVGNHALIGNWNPGAVPLTYVDATHRTITLQFLEGTALEYKFTRGSWDNVMKGADGNEEMDNLPVTVDYGTDGTQLYEYTVLNWRDPIVTDFTPADAATGVPVDTVVTATWSQAMTATVCLTLTQSLVSVPGTCNYDDLTYTVTFTPTAMLDYETVYAALVSGQVDFGGDAQQVPAAWTFTTAAPDYDVTITPATAAQSGLPGVDVTYNLTVANTGDVEDTFDVSVSSVWTASPSVTTITVPAGSTGSLDVTVTVPTDALAGASDIATVTVTSQNNALATDSSALTTSAGAVYGMAITPTAMTEFGLPGQQVTYLLTVHNTGNIADTYNITIDAAWSTATDPIGTINVAANSTAVLSVMVTVPTTASDGETDMATITLVSQTDAEVTDETTLTTQAYFLKVYLPLIIR